MMFLMSSLLLITNCRSPYILCSTALHLLLLLIIVFFEEKKYLIQTFAEFETKKKD